MTRKATITIFTPPGSRAYLSVEGHGRRRTMAGTLHEAFMSHEPALLRYFRARGARVEAEDLVQELWLKLTASAFIEANDPLAYLYRMAHNLMLDRRRSDMRRRTREEHYHDQLGTAADAPDAERTLLAREQLRQVEAALSELGPKTNHIFRRHRVDGTAQRHIADELGITLSAVEKHLQKAYRAVASLRSGQADARQAAPGKEKRDDRR